MSRVDSTAANVILWGVVLIAAIIVLAAVVWLVRRWMHSVLQKEPEGGWSLQHLREMKEQGRITEKEFESLRFKVLEASRRSAEGQERATSAGGRRPR